MSSVSKRFFKFSLGLLGYKKLITVLNITCNAGIFGYQAGIVYLARLILNAIETGVRGEVFSSIIIYLILLLAVSLSRILFIMSCAVLDGRRSYYYQNRTRLNLISRLFKGDAASVAGNSGKVFELLDDDVPVISFPAELFSEVSGFCIYALATVCILLSIDWRVTLFVFIPLSAAIYGVQRLSDRVKEKRRVSRAAHDGVSSFVSDTADSILSIKATGSEASFTDEYDRRNAERRTAILTDAKLNVGVDSLINTAVFMGIGIMMFIAARMLTGGTMRIGDFSIFIASLDTLGNCVTRIVELVNESKKAEVSYERILSAAGSADHGFLLNKIPLSLHGEIKIERNAYKRIPLTSLKAEGLTYAYSETAGVFDIGLELKAGQFYAVAGGIGNGKSTLLRLLAGSLTPQAGKIKWNNTTIEPKSFCLPPNTVYVTQRGGFFSGDILSNLELGEELKSLNESIEFSALGAVLREKPEGLKTVIGNHGDMLSGGQRQRLALARAFSRKAELTLIDDSISALDEHTKLRVLSNFKRYVKAGHTLFIATNSASVLSTADKVYFMQDGHITTEGSYEELRNSSHEFALTIT